MKDQSPATSKGESIRARYATTIVVQFFQLLASVVTAGVVPRALGPAVYGSYNFLLGMASTVRATLTLGTQQTFFTKSSQTKDSGSLTKLYALFLVGQWIFIMGFIFAIHVLGLQVWVWPNQYLNQIVIVTSLEWLIFVALTLEQLGDTKKLTIYTQILTGIGSFLNAGGLLILALLHRLNFYSYTFWMLFVTVLISTGLSVYLLGIHRDVCWTGTLFGQTRKHIQDWRRYASPLIVYSAASALLTGLDIYLIQCFYGPQEQGYFALASRWASLSLTFTGAALSIYWREIASSLAARDRERAREIYLRFSHLLFFLTLVLSCWLCLGARHLVQSIAGMEYLPAAPLLMIMAFYPVQQTFGQLCGAAFLASERTREYRNYGILFAGLGAVVTYFLLAPRSAAVPGLGLGARGVALKMVVLGMLTVQFYELSNARFFQFSYLQATIDKMKTTLVVGGIAFVILRGLIRQMGIPAGRVGIIPLGLISVFYFLVVGLVAFFCPVLAGLRAQDIDSAVADLKTNMASIRLRRRQ